MESSFASFLPTDSIDLLLAMPFAEVWLTMGFLGLTASIYATGIPGALLPISFSSGAMLGGVLGVGAVAAGATAGSVLLYVLLKRSSEAALRRKYGGQMQRLDDLASRGGILSIIGMRLVGVPHVAVTAICAFGSVGGRRYALATIVGLFPAIALSATAGASL